ncbi:MAG: TadE/TadG family type IV pilus assembly protein [Armatimonadota bacterium]|nr:TadE/TadG family type IV pilus assembly protein [Armatimonadota bacterium]
MKRVQQPKVHSERGQALVEFALSATLFLFLVLGVAQLALLGRVQLVLTHASREGVRYASVRGVATSPAEAQQADALIKNYVLARAAALRTPPLQESDITITPSGVARPSNSSITVSVVYRAQATVPLLAPLFPGGIPLGASSTTRIE